MGVFIMNRYMSKVSHNGSREGCIGPRQFLKLLSTHFKSVENNTDGRCVPYITGCVVNFKINMK